MRYFGGIGVRRGLPAFCGFAALSLASGCYTRYQAQPSPSLSVQAGAVQTPTVSGVGMPDASGQNLKTVLESRSIRPAPLDTNDTHDNHLTSSSQRDTRNTQVSGNPAGLF